MNRQRDTYNSIVICLLLCATAIFVLWPVVHFDFITLDDRYYVKNDWVKAGITWPGVIWAFRHSYASNWHPLTWLSHMLDVQLFGMAPSGHHSVNLLFHAANTMLLFLLLRGM